MSSPENLTLPSVPESSVTPSMSLPPAAKAASEAAVRLAIMETKSTNNSIDEREDGEIDDADEAKPNSSRGMVTVLHDPANFNVVHPLYSTWTLWFDNASKQDKAKDWNEQLQEVMEIQSVEEFWGLYNNIVPPSHISINSNYYLFKKGIKPAWEDDANAKGGKWSIQCPRDKSRDSIDRWWLYTMLAAIGETFETPYTSSGTISSDAKFTDEVTGVIVSSRKMFYRINIWTRSSDNRARVEEIGKHFKYGVMGVPEGLKIGQDAKGGIASDVEFTSHSASQSRGKKAGWTV